MFPFNSATAWVMLDDGDRAYTFYMHYYAPPTLTINIHCEMNDLQRFNR